MTEQNNTTEQTTDANEAALAGGVDPSVTAASEAAVAPKKRKTVIAKADLTVEYLKSKLELRLDAIPTGAKNEDGTDKVNADGTPETKTFKNFYWLVDTTAARAGDHAGSYRPVDGYYSVVLAGTNYSGGQLAFFYENGEWPKKDSKNADGTPAIKRGRKAADGAAAEPKVHVKRVFALPTAEEMQAAKEAAAAKAAKKKAAKEAAAKATAEATPEVAAAPVEAAAAETTAVAASVDPTAVADINEF